jgi:hypothetical protein
LFAVSKTITTTCVPSRSFYGKFALFGSSFVWHIISNFKTFGCRAQRYQK